MFGYDTLIGSHFDKYTIDYYNYDEEPIDSTLFHITDGIWRFFPSRRNTFLFSCLCKEMQCRSFPDSETEHTSARVLFNPMSEYLHGHGASAVDDSFDEFKKKHGLEYNSEHEHRHRLKLFRNNHRYVNAKNRAALTYRMKLNKFADRTVRRSLKKNSAGKRRERSFYLGWWITSPSRSSS